MTAKQLFRKVRGADRTIKGLEEHIQKAYSELMRITPQLSEIQVQTTGGRGQLDKAPEFLDLINRANRQVAKISALRSLALSVIEQLDDPRHQNVLTYYYLNGNSWEQTARKMNYAYRYIFDLAQQALHEADKVLTKSEHFL